MKLEHKLENNVCVMFINGNLLGETDSKPIVGLLEEQIENKIVHFVIDLTKLNYVNSTGLSVLLTILSKSRNAGGELCLVNVNDQLGQLLKMTKLEAVLPIGESVEAAINKFSAN